MLHDIIFLLLGLALVLGGANYLTDGAVAVARKLHMSDLMIGLTIVAIGSSTPDLVVSLTSTLQNKGALAAGNIVGANIFDIFLVVGLCALVRPVVIGRATLQKEFPLVLLSSLVFAFMACDSLIDGLGYNLIDRSDGLILLCFFIIYCYVTYLVAKTPNPSDSSTDSDSVPSKHLRVWLACVMIGGGLAGLIIGGNWFVSSASGIAEKCGMSQALVGLTIAAIGSSLPDLSTSLIAAVKGHSGLAIGNIVGSCALNVFFTIGLCAVVKPLQLGSINAIDFAILIGGSILICLFGWLWGKRTITRTEGAILALCYAGYIVYLVLSGK